ncbi:HlyD family secretion protein [Pseudomonas putida]|uniref:HlyD family secretion protein n=1 Tax=Pseudomonas putida TaxID=303 RepID=UPI002DBF1A8E|nr:HlyD family secretion protein [Pseudomonas putida]WRW03114.1 HlyD family secretion protein [Pseudomonas putida]
MKQHKTALSLLAAAVALCVLYAGYRITSPSALQTTDDAYVRADSVMVAPRVSGQIAKVLVEDNQEVKAGQLLAELDDQDFVAARAAAAANLLSAQAEVLNLTASVARQSAVIDQTTAKTRSTAASLKFAEANAQRYRNLSTTGAGTRQEQQKADSELQRWQANRDQDEANRIAATKMLDVQKAQLEAAKAAVARAQAALDQADLNLSYTHIVAPQDGIVGQRTVRVGAFVHTGDVLLAVVPVHEAFVVANFRETQLTHMNAEQTVELRVDSLPDRVFTGHIDSIAPATGLSFSKVTPDNATGNFTKVIQRVPVKILLDKGQADLDRLRIGMSVVASVDTHKAHQ